MSTEFLYPIDWARGELSVTTTIPFQVSQSRILKEQRNTTFDQDEVLRTYTLPYSNIGFDPDKYDETKSVIEKALLTKGDFILPFWFERLYQDGFDFDNQSLFSCAPQLGGPDWWQTKQILFPDIPLSGPPANIEHLNCYVARINSLDWTQAETRQLTAYTYNPGFLTFTTDITWSTWNLPETQLDYYFCDNVISTGNKARSFSDDVHGFELSWQSVL